MTPDRARRVLLTFRVTLASTVLLLLGLLGYGLAHPLRHKVLLILMAMGLGPIVLTVILRRSGIRALLHRGSQISPTSIPSRLLRAPSLILMFPLLITAVSWAILLTTIGMKEDEDQREWLKNRTVSVLVWVMVPQVLVAYLCVSLHAAYVGMYIAACIIYLTVTTAVIGLNLENGVVKFFSTYKTHASPLVIVCLALFCCASFGVLHFAVWSLWPSEYFHLEGIEDAVYFSVVTMATVGYGDILPVGHIARWLCILEIISGILLLVVGVSASMTIWLQKNQPALEGNAQNSKQTPGSE